MKVEVDVMGSPSLNSPYRLCGREGTMNSFLPKRWTSLGSPSLNSPYGLCGSKATLNYESSELRSCVKVKVSVLGSPSLIVRTISVDVKQQLTRFCPRAQELCEGRGGRPGLPVLMGLMVSVNV